jgi:hypothetical protein
MPLAADAASHVVRIDGLDVTRTQTADAKKTAEQWLGGQSCHT